MSSKNTATKVENKMSCSVESAMDHPRQAPKWPDAYELQKCLLFLRGMQLIQFPSLPCPSARPGDLGRPTEWADTTSVPGRYKLPTRGPPPSLLPCVSAEHGRCGRGPRSLAGWWGHRMKGSPGSLNLCQRR